MAGRSPIGIVKEYLEPNESVQVRKNALSALAALHVEESLIILADVASGDKDAQVRERAEHELASLDRAAAPIALARIFERLRDTATMRHAYALLGRLRDAGMTFQFPELPMTARLMLARALSSLLNPRRGFRFNFRWIKGLLLGTVTGLVVMALYLGVMTGQTGAEFVGAVIGFAILSAILMVIVATIALRLSVPARLQPDTAASAIVEAVTIAIVTFGTTAMLLSFEIATDSPTEYDGYALVLAAVPAAAVVVRLATLAMFGLRNSRPLSYLAQLVVGGLCGIGTYELMAMLGGDAPEIVGLASGFVMTGAFALAGAYADVDRESVAAPVTPPPAGVAALIVAAVGVGIMAVPAIPPPEARLPQGSIELPHTVEIRQVPAVITYAAARNTGVVLDPRGSYAVTEPQTGPDGTTEVRITRDASTTADDVWWHLVQTSRMRTWAELQARLTRGAPASAAVLVRATVDRGCDVTQIALGTEIQGELRTTSCRTQNSSAYYDRYVFNATAGQQIIVTARADFDTALDLKKSSGETIQSNDDTENLNPRIEARLEDTGDYVIDLRGLTATGKYTLHLVSR